MILNPHEYSKLLAGKHKVCQRFVKKYNVVTDNDTNLQWKIYGDGAKINHQEASGWINGLFTRGWGFPVEEEFLSILTPEGRLDPVFENVGRVIWSYRDMSDSVWAYCFLQKIEDISHPMSGWAKQGAMSKASVLAVRVKKPI